MRQSTRSAGTGQETAITACPRCQGCSQCGQQAGSDTPHGRRNMHSQRLTSLTCCIEVQLYFGEQPHLQSRWLCFRTTKPLARYLFQKPSSRFRPAIFSPTALSSVLPADCCRHSVSRVTGQAVLAKCKHSLLVSVFRGECWQNAAGTATPAPIVSAVMGSSQHFDCMSPNRSAREPYRMRGRLGGRRQQHWPAPTGQEPAAMGCSALLLPASPCDRQDCNF